jgi:hypothetical protein
MFIKRSTATIASIIDSSEVKLDETELEKKKDAAFAKTSEQETVEPKIVEEKN